MGYLKALLLLMCALAAGPALGQESLVRMPAGEATVEQVIEQIQSQTGIMVGVNHRNFDVSRKIRVGTAGVSTEQLLEMMVAGTDHTYIRRGKHAIIVAQPKKKAARPVAAVVPSGNPGSPAETVTGAPQTAAETTEPEAEWVPPIGFEMELPEGEQPRVRTWEEILSKQSDQVFSFSTQDPAVFTKLPDKYPWFAIKTNLLGAATLAPNLGVEVAMGRKTTLELTGGFNRWHRNGTFEDNKKLIHTWIQPEFRWWFCERFNGHFVGVHALGANYNISQHNIPFINFKKQYRYQGYAVGAGVSYGYGLMLSRTVGMEFTLGFGAVWLKYDRYDCVKCADEKEKFTKTHFAPTKAGVSFVIVL